MYAELFRERKKKILQAEENADDGVLKLTGSVIQSNNAIESATETDRRKTVSETGKGKWESCQGQEELCKRDKLGEQRIAQNGNGTEGLRVREGGWRGTTASQSLELAHTR